MKGVAPRNQAQEKLREVQAENQLLGKLVQDFQVALTARWPHVVALRSTAARATETNQHSDAQEETRKLQQQLGGAKKACKDAQDAAAAERRKAEVADRERAHLEGEMEKMARMLQSHSVRMERCARWLCHWGCLPLAPCCYLML
jgi:hypothetical protein